MISKVMKVCQLFTVYYSAEMSVKGNISLSLICDIVIGNLFLYPTPPPPPPPPHTHLMGLNWSGSDLSRGGLGSRVPFVLPLDVSVSPRLALVSLGEDGEEEGALGAEGSRERRSGGL